MSVSWNANSAKVKMTSLNPTEVIPHNNPISPAITRKKEYRLDIFQ